MDIVEKLRTRNGSPTGFGLGPVCDEAASEIERLRSALATANEQAERFERGWYLRGDALEVAVRQNEHDMLMTGEELRACREALGA